MLRNKLKAVNDLVISGLVTIGIAFYASFFPVTAQAFPPLNLVPGTPDIFSGFITTNYVGDNNAGTLTAVGQSFTLTPPGAPIGNITGGTFNINSNLSFNSLSAAGTLNIGGQIAGLGFNSGTLLTGTLNAFGAGPGDPLEFLFNVTGGDAATLYGGIGAQAGVILSGSGYSGSFASAFSGVNGLSDTFGTSVPLPGTLLLMLSGSSVLMFRRRKANSSH